MSSYEALAGCYDRFTTDVDYGAWADFIEKQIQRRHLTAKRVLDLACGTGSLTYELASRGYEMTGVDLSYEMLSVAEEKNRDVHPTQPAFFCQPMQRLLLPQPVDVCVCCLDSVNYVTKPLQLQRAFSRVYETLNDGGLFLFDINTPEKLTGLDGQMFLDETEDAYCVWRAEYSVRRRICTYFMDIFEQTGDLWQRETELHEEYAYEPAELTAFLQQAGFMKIRQYGNLRLRKPQPGEDRIFFVAQKR